MPHNLVKFITDDDGESMAPLWHFPIVVGASNVAICNGHVFGYGESSATYETKVVQRGGITCDHCKHIIKSLKKVKL